MSPSVSDADLSVCDREPIHLLGGIQPRGVLVAFRKDTEAVAVVSANVHALLGAGPDALLGKPLSRVLPHGLLARVEAGVGPGPVTVEVSGQRCSALLHDSDGLRVLELEPLADEDVGAEETALGAVQRLVSPLARAKGSTALLQEAADAVRELIGYDRVMVYRFHADFHGEVVAESLREGVDSFLGLHYPATDIPVQARALYTRHPVRLIADVNAKVVALVPAVLPGTQRPLDLSGAALRGVSEIHLEYLRNMGVGASFSVSLLKDGQLWGLMACHHLTPRKVSAARRQACEVLARLLALQLSAEERGLEAAAQARRASLLNMLVMPKLGERTPANALEAQAPLLMELTGSHGVALVLGASAGSEASPLLLGTTPSAEEVRALVAWLSARELPDEVFYVDRLGDVYPPLASRADVAAGLLAVRLDPSVPHFALWFRPEVARTVAWAGNPHKPVRPEPGHERLRPRASFDVWREEMRGASTPWSAQDLEAGRALKGALVGVVLRHAEELARLSRELARSNAELDAFGGTVAHDLKEPLRGILQYSSFLQEDFGPTLGADGRAQLEALAWLAKRTHELLDNLFEYSRLGRLELSWEEMDQQALVEDVLKTLGARLEEGRVEVRLPRRLPTAACDPIRIRQVWANLISNAAKYQTAEPRWVEVGFLGPGETRPEAARHVTAPYLFYVKDPGIGIAPHFHEAIFELFRRLHPAQAYGGGTGAGLAISRRLVSLHGGALWVDSALGKGSTFFFTLGEEPRP
ncbi:ATP-binding protein [Corallococcus carmarthensis]|uniref:histidine kinase n=1 Tax=Corallococcus carmarthensis TaxID=2316728 RepID=A0A3A8KCZ6_9BACT|nr:ATP-binding protein [Corallococcus carmarthensis]NOK16048.1 GAF domain-containing protein [Corallococcus carmarthensis]RKH05177.1 GAF domain-containing protein [Corallococcus carmarthensis]